MKWESTVSFKKCFIGIQLIYNIVLVSGVQQSESVIHTHIQSFLDYCPHVRPCSDIWRQHFWLLCYSSFFFFLIFLHKIVLTWVWCLRPLGHPDSLQNCIKSDFVDIPVQILSRACKDIHICTKKLLTLHDLSRQKFKFFHESGSWKLKEFYCIIWEIWSG